MHYIFKTKVISVLLLKTLHVKVRNVSAKSIRQQHIPGNKVESSQNASQKQF